MVDPLDGTWNFIEGRPEFAVCIGLVDSGTPTLGVVYNPISNTAYHARRGEGAYRDGEAIRARGFPEAAPTLVASSEELRRGSLDAVRAECETTTVGSTALKIAQVAEGAADLYLSTRTKGIWDVCAGWVLATEAGASMTSLRGEPIDFSPRAPEVRGLIVAGVGGEIRALDLAKLAKESS